MPHPNGDPTLIEQFEEYKRQHYYTKDILKEAQEMMQLIRRAREFLNVYYTGDAQTFVDPDNGKLVSANYEVRAFAAAILAGLASDDPPEGEAKGE